MWLQYMFFNSLHGEDGVVKWKHLSISQQPSSCHMCSRPITYFLMIPSLCTNEPSGNAIGVHNTAPQTHVSTYRTRRCQKLQENSKKSCKRDLTVLKVDLQRKTRRSLTYGNVVKRAHAYTWGSDTLLRRRIGSRAKCNWRMWAQKRESLTDC